MKKLRADRDAQERAAGERRQQIAEARRVIARAEEIRAKVAALRAAEAEVERLEGLRDRYDALVAQRRASDDALREAERQLRGELRIAEGELAGMRKRAARLPELAQEIARIGEQQRGLGAAVEELARQRQRRGELQEQVQQIYDLQIQRKELEGQIKLKHDSLVATREEHKRRVKEALQRLAPAERWRAELAQLLQERAALEREQASAEELRRTEHESVERAGALRAACDSIKQQGDEINKKLALLKGDAQACPLCGSELGHDGLAHIEASYDRDRKALRAQYSGARREADALEAGLVELRSQIAGLEQRLGRLPELAARIARLEGDLQQAEELRARQAEDQRVVDELNMQLVKGDFELGARGEMSRVDAVIAGIGNPESIRRDTKRLEERIAKLEQQADEQARLGAQIEGLRREHAAIAAEAPLVAEQEARLSELRTTLEMGDFAHEQRVALEQNDNQLQALGYKPEGHKAAREQVQQLRPWAEQERQLALAEGRIELDEQALAQDEQRLAATDAELGAAAEQLNRLEQDLRALAPAQRRREEAEAALKECRKSLNVAQRDLGERQGDLRRAEEAAADLLAVRARREDLMHRKGLFDELTAAFGKKGVQALLIETAIPEIEREANSLLGRMTDNQMHLTFETQRDTKKGDVAETLEIKIADALGTRDYNAYSGGESFRVDFAIRIALAKLLAHRAGARLETLVIDEGFGSQDAKGRERLVEAITSVQPDFKQILVVTHIQDLKDMFPVQIEIAKTPQGSRWALG
jgi:exonuclease SbcC